jgi:threonylcarbamoyladenosine tRNA methylthiotransferase MtaB
MVFARARGFLPNLRSKTSLMSKFFVQNFGCRASQADGAALEAQLAAHGLECAPGRHAADFVILNTCTVTSSADEDLRQTVRRVHRENPQSRILVTGCYAQRAPEELAALTGVEWVVGNSHKAGIGELLTEAAREGGAGCPAPYHSQILVGDIFASQDFLTAPVIAAAADRARPNLKIQDGCNNRCSFCIIPFVRGRSRSSSPEMVVEQVRNLAARYREVVLSGISLGRWGREAGRADPGGKPRLAGLLRRLLDETEIQRLRLSSVEPMDFSDELLGLMAESPRIAKHVHAPLQSGSDRVLRRMHRKYRPRHYADRILRARRLMPDAAMGADVMTGFPGETDAEFEESRAFIDSLPFTYLHVFTYSERPGTPAADMPDPVPIPLRRERNRILRELAARKNLEFRCRMIGRRLSAVTLEEPCAALSDNYLKVELASFRPANQMIEVEIGGLREAGLRENFPPGESCITPPCSGRACPAC